MTTAIDSNTGSATQASTNYWDREPNLAPLDRSRDGVFGGAGRAAQDEPATPVNGGDTNSSERHTRRTVDDRKTVEIDRLEQTRNVTIERERTITDPDRLGRQFVTNDQLVFSTGAGDDTVRVTNNDDGSLAIEVNGEEFRVEMARGQQLTLRTGAGDDVIDIAPDVRVSLIIDAGDGADQITTGAGDTLVFGGAGDDVITLGSGNHYVEAGAGDDVVIGGDGYNVIYGGDGDDVLIGGNGGNYIDGGAGDDRLSAGAGDDILIGGRGNDHIDLGADSEVEVQSGDTLSHIALDQGVPLSALIRANPQLANPNLIHPGQLIQVERTGGGVNRVYAGDGDDRVVNAGASDVIHAQSTDRVSGNDSVRVVNIEIDPALGQSIRIEGSPEFRERVMADLDFLRSSPNGQQMLAELDRAAGNGNTVTLRELENENNGFATESRPGTWRDTEIRNGQAGAGGDTDIVYNPSFSDPAIFPAPSVVLYHEMSHAYNAVTGTFQPGSYNGPDVQDHGVPNAERQAVGLEASAPPFDFDRDPATPPTTTNPRPLTENGLREELNLPLRPSYRL